MQTYQHLGIVINSLLLFFDSTSPALENTLSDVFVALFCGVFLRGTLMCDEKKPSCTYQAKAALNRTS